MFSLQFNEWSGWDTTTDCMSRREWSTIAEQCGWWDYHQCCHFINSWSHLWCVCCWRSSCLCQQHEVACVSRFSISFLGQSTFQHLANTSTTSNSFSLSRHLCNWSCYCSKWIQCGRIESSFVNRIIPKFSYWHSSNSSGSRSICKPILSLQSIVAWEFQQRRKYPTCY